MQWDFEQFSIPNRFNYTNPYHYRNRISHDCNMCSSYNSLHIRSLATSIHRDIYQLCDQQLAQNCEFSGRYISHANNSSMNRQMYKILEKISVLNKKVVNLEKLIKKEIKNKCFPDSQNYNYRTICNSTKSLINITTSLKYDLLNECRPCKPMSCHIPVCSTVSGVPDVVEKIIMLENHLFELLTEIECRLEKEKFKLNLQTNKLPSHKYKNMQKGFKFNFPGYNPHCTCQFCVRRNDLTDRRYITECVACDDAYQRRKFQVQKSNIICYSSSFNDDRDVCKHPVSFIYIKKKSSDKHASISRDCRRKHKMQMFKCPKIKRTISVTNSSTTTCRSCVNIVRQISSTRLNVGKPNPVKKAIRRHKVKNVNQNIRHRSCTSVNKSSGLLDIRKSLCVTRVCPKVKRNYKPLSKCKSCLKIVKSHSSVIFDVRKSASNRTMRKTERGNINFLHNLNITKSHSPDVLDMHKSVKSKYKKTKPKKIRHQMVNCKTVSQSHMPVERSSLVDIVNAEETRSVKKLYQKVQKMKSKYIDTSCCSILTCCSISKTDSSVTCDSRKYPVCNEMTLYNGNCLPCIPRKPCQCTEEVYVKTTIGKSRTRIAKPKERKPTTIKPTTKSKTKYTWTESIKCTDSAIQVKLKESREKVITDDKAIDPVEELNKKKVKPEKITTGSDALNLTQKKETAESGVNVDTIEKQIKKPVRTTGSEAYRPDMITRGTYKKPAELVQSETNTDIRKTVSHSTSPIFIDLYEKPVMFDKKTSQERIELKQVATNTDVKNTNEQRTSTARPETAHKEVHVHTLKEEKKPDVIQAETNTELVTSNIKIGTSIIEFREKQTSADMKQQTLDKKTNTQRQEFKEKEIHVNIRGITEDKRTNTQKQEFKEKEINVNIKGKTEDKKTNTSNHEQIETKPPTDRMETLVATEPEKGSSTLDFKHSITRYLRKPQTQAYIHERSSVHKLPDGEYQENYDAKLETEFVKVLNKNCNLCNKRKPCCYCQYDLEREYQRILEMKCQELLNGKGYKLIKDKKSKRQHPSYSKHTINRNKKNRKLMRQKQRYSPKSSETDTNYRIISKESIRYIKKPRSNTKNENKSMNSKDKPTSQEEQNVLNDNAPASEISNAENEAAENVKDPKKIIQTNNGSGKKLMHLTYSSKSSIQILLPSGAELYEEEDKETGKLTKKISIRKEVDHTPDNAWKNVGNKKRYNSRWKEVVDRIDDNYRVNKRYDKYFSDSSDYSFYDYSSDDYSSELSTTSSESSRRRIWNK